MPKINMPSFVVTRRIYTEPWQADFIDKKMDLANRIYNNAVRYLKPAVEELRRDAWFVKNLACGGLAATVMKNLKNSTLRRSGSASGPMVWQSMTSMPSWAAASSSHSRTAWGSTLSRNWGPPYTGPSGRLYFPARNTLPQAWTDLLPGG